MARLYELALDKRNTGPTFFIQNTDPVTADSAYVRAGTPWIKTENDTDPWGAVVSFNIRNADDTAWIVVALGSAGDGTGTGLDADTLDGLDSLAFVPQSLADALGDLFYASAADTFAKLTGNTTATKQFLTQTGDGANSAAPAWGAIASGDLPSHEHAGDDITSGTVANEWLEPAPVATQSGATYTFVLGDAGTYIRFTNAAGCAATIPANASVAYPVGTELHGIGTLGQVTLVADTGVTINTPETLLTAKAMAAFTAKKVATNEWDLMGYLEAAP